MDLPIYEINKIRNDRKSVLRSNKFLNRYMLEIDNKDLTTTSYVFSVPIFNITDGNLVNLKFSQGKWMPASHRKQCRHYCAK